MFRFLFCLSLFCSVMASGQVVLTEVHYHPVEEETFDSSWNPTLDLSADVHEFVEIQNTGTTTLNLGGWRLAGGVQYTFPSGTTIAAGGYKVIARTPARIETVYTLTAGSVLGPYTGRLSNNSDTVRVENAASELQDSITYESRFPWAAGADALGAQDRFTGLNSLTYNYKGRSLQRVSITAATGDPANWLASPLTGPTPGTAQAVTRTVPKPVVISQSYAQASDSAAIIRAAQAVTVNAAFSSTVSLSAVTLEYFLDDPNNTSETRTEVTMTNLGSGRYTASIPGQVDRSIIRYRFKANRGDGVEAVSPRADDPPTAPIGASGALEAWWGYFITPVRTSANPTYDLLVSSAGLTQMATNISQGTTNPKRVTLANASGIPRDKPTLTARGQTVTPTTPEWNGTVHAVFSHNGDLYDVHIRYHGSRYHRVTTNFSYKLHFPSHQPFNAQSSWFITPHGNEFVEATKMNRLLGLPASKMRSVDWYLNDTTMITRREQGEYGNEMLDEYHELQQQLNPGSTKEQRGELYKVVGNIGTTQNNTEGPYTKGDNAPMLANTSWTKLERYYWNYNLQSNGWKGPVPAHDMVEGMWTARGDTPAATNLTGTNLANAKAWLTANYDIDATLTSLAMLQWIGIWDDTGHNQFFWRRANSKWVRLGWDYDGVMTSSRYNQSIYANESGSEVFTPSAGPSWFKDTFFKCFRTEFNQRLWELNNSFFDPVNLTANGLTTASTFSGTNGRQVYVNQQLSTLGTYTKPARPTNSTPATGNTILSATNLTTSAFSHPASSTHASTLWELRSAAGNYEEPLLRVTSTTNKTSYPVPFDLLTYGATYFWRATHIDNAGHPSVVSAETSFTWGTTSATAGNIVINEVMAYNRNYAQNGTDYPDYVELYNNTGAAVAVAGWTLTDDPLVPGKYTFPAGSSIPANSYLTLWADKDTTSPGLHTGFGLDADGDQLLLLNGTTIVDSVTFGPQVPDLSIGRVVNGTGGWQLNNPTRGTANSARTLGSLSNLRINEWMATPAYFDDWFELYNADANPVSLAGLYLSDTPSTPLITQVPALSFINGKGYTRFWADSSTAGGNHCNFKLSGAGESLVVTASNGSTTLDTVTFSAQSTDMSQGRLPEGSTTTVSFTNKTASPGYFNWAPATVVINEVLANSASPQSDTIELHNPTASAVVIGGWWLSDDLNVRQKYQFPAGTSIAAGGYLTVTESQMLAATVPFSLSAYGDEVVLTAPDSSASVVRFGTSQSNVSFGRVVATGLNAQSGNAEFWPQSILTLGAANGLAKLGQVVINEVMYHPPDSGTVDVFGTEFVELHNNSGSTVNLAGWRLKGDSEFTFATGTSLPAGGYLLVVGFNPVTDTTSLNAFFTAYPSLGSSGVQIVGPFTPKLVNNTQSLEIAEPVVISGNTVYVNQDKVEYRDIAPWATAPDGTGPSLQRTSALLIGNSASSWASATATPRAVNTSVLLGLSITTSSPLPGGALGQAYSTVLTASAGTVPYSWAITSGNVPGLVLNSNGTYSGTPTTAGTYNLTLQVTDSANIPVTASKPVSVTIAATALNITTSTLLPNATAGTSYSQTFTSTGGSGSGYTWSLDSGALPAGLSLSTAGVLSGMSALTATGTFNFTVRVLDTANYSVTKNFSLTVPVPPLVVTTSSPMVGGMLGDFYSQALTASGGVPSYNWALHSGALPGGLSLSTDGTVSGTCNVHGTFNFTARVTDSASTTATMVLSITVSPYPLSILTSALPSGVLNDSYSQTLSASGGVAPLSWSVHSGTLPNGLSLSAAGVLTGTLTPAGMYNFTLRVTDATNTTAQQVYTVTVSNSGPLDHFTWNYVPTSAYVNSAFAVQVTARDEQERVVSSFNGSVNLTAQNGSGKIVSPIQITEVTDAVEDQIELQNVSTAAVNTTGWFLRVSQSLTDINLLNSTVFNLPASFPTGGLIRVTENQANHNPASNIYQFSSTATNTINWSSTAPTSKGYALLFDNTNVLRDVFIFGWTAEEQDFFNVTVNSTAFTLAGQWTGNGSAPGTRAPSSTVDSWQRTGTTDNNVATDWTWRHNANNSNATSFNTTNVGLTVPWSIATPVSMTPSTVTLQNGTFTGYITIMQAGVLVRVTANDGASHTGQSAGINVISSTDTNNNSLPDAWETANSVTSATADNDNDGQTNAQEYLAGTNPNSQSSKLQILSIGKTSSTVDLTWSTVAGKLYRVSYSDDLGVWTPLSQLHLAQAVGTLSHSISSGTQQRQFYRVEVAP